MPDPKIVLTSRFDAAFEYSRHAHDGQTRKGTCIPYISHPMAVASLVMSYGGDEDQAIAGLLHDVIEDCGEHHEAIIRKRFGARVAGMVLDLTDGTAESKASVETPAAKRDDWKRRKLAYITHLAGVGKDSLLVSACDKLHNARTIVEDLDNPAVGLGVFDRFKAGREGTLWYYGALAHAFAELESPVVLALQAAVRSMECGRADVRRTQ